MTATMSLKALESLERNSVAVASCSNGNRRHVTEDRSLWHCKTLYWHRPTQRFYFREFGGCRMNVNNQPVWISESDALEWIVSEANDPVTDYRYTREQAEAMIVGATGADQ